MTERSELSPRKIMQKLGALNVLMNADENLIFV